MIRGDHRYDKLYRNNWRRDPVSGDNSNKQIFILHIFRGNKQIDYRQARQLSNLLVFWQGRKSACYPSVTIFRRQYINLSLKNGHKRKMRARLSSTKGCISFFHTYICFARIVLLVQGTILSSRQIVTCKQHFPLTTIFLFKECCNEHQPLHIFTAILNVNHTLHIV